MLFQRVLGEIRMGAAILNPTRLIHEYGIGSLLYHDISPSIGRYKRATRLIKADSFIELILIFEATLILRTRE